MTTDTIRVMHRTPGRWLTSGLRRLVRQLHRDDGGNLGILLLLTIWALVLLIAMVWNTAEVSTRRAHVQNSADATAHALATWMVRVTNQESATNMAICQNASAEILLRAVQPTIDSIAQHLTNEEATLKRRLYGDTPGKGERRPDFEYWEEILGLNAWSGNARGTQLINVLDKIQTDTNALLVQLNPYLSAAQASSITNGTLGPIANNKIRLTYVQGTWIDGGNPTNAAYPGPPDLGGKGLRNILGPWVLDTKGRYQPILDALPSEWAIWQAFIDQTLPAMATDPSSLAGKRSDIHEYQLRFADAVPPAAEEQRQRMATLYKTTITVADPENGPFTGNNGSGSLSAAVQAPVMEANVPEPMEHADSIRLKYPVETEQHFGTAEPRVLIDAINVHMDFAAIWHPGASVQAAVVPGGPVHTYKVQSGEYGELSCAPLARYLNDRVWRDAQGLSNLLAQIDAIRAGVRARVYPMAWPPNPVAALETVITLNATSVPPQTFSMIPQTLSRLPKPGGISPALSQAIDDVNTLIQRFNTEAPGYVQDVGGMFTNQPARGISQLEHVALAMDSELNSTTSGFASYTWAGQVDRFRYQILRDMGYTKGFMVLKPYALRPIPEWARAPIQQSAYQYAYNDIYSRSLGGFSSGWSIYQWNTWTHWDGVIGAVHRDIMNDLIAQGQPMSQARSTADARATALGQQICAQASTIVATDVAYEYVQRPWPYEITPPANASDENCSGWLTVDRAKYFTLLVGAKNTEENKPKFAMSAMLGEGPETIAAFAQGEAFNWMEYNSAYGAGDAYNQVSSYGHYVLDFGRHVMGGSPPPWRLCTVGGWSWQPRLALSDELPRGIEKNPEFQQQFDAGGVPGIDAAALRALIMH